SLPALLVSVLTWFGGRLQSPRAAMEQEALSRAVADSILDDSLHAHRSAIQALQLQVHGVATLVAATTTKSCLDAEEAGRAERLKMARAQVPCDSLYRQQR